MKKTAGNTPSPMKHWRVELLAHDKKVVWMIMATSAFQARQQALWYGAPKVKHIRIISVEEA